MSELLESASTVSEFRNKARTLRLSLADRKRIVEQAIVLLEQNYGHLPFKRSMHAVDPVQRLKLLRFRLENQSEDQRPPAERFHREMLSTFASVRDLHTLYLLPRPYKNALAFLPFEVGEYFEDGARKYVVTAVIEEVMKDLGHETTGPDAVPFRRGAELLHWNGVPIARAVELLAESTHGGNAAAREARGLARLTLRPLAFSLPPDEQWVDVRYHPPDPETPAKADRSKELELRLPWKVFEAPTTVEELGRQLVKRRAAGFFNNNIFASIASGDDGTVEEKPAPAPAAPVPGPAAAPADRFFSRNIFRPDFLGDSGSGLDVEAEFLRQARLRFYRPDVYGARPGKSETAQENQYGDENFFVGQLETYDSGVFEAFEVRRDDQDYGLIRIHTFAVAGEKDDAAQAKAKVDRFVEEFAEILDKMPRRGLLLDVRGNGGGKIPAAERLLQLLTPGTIEPARFQLLNSEMNLELARKHTDLFGKWRDSIEQAVATGSIYSRGFPITDPKDANAIGQRYYGPVVLLVDANCYSATDVFIAGFQDHEIGEILGIHDNTGAGGASVASQSALAGILGGDRSPYAPLPNGTGMQVALRRAVRVGPNAGTPLEDLGVKPDKRHSLTQRDLLEANQGLYEHAIETYLKDKPVHYLHLSQIDGRKGTFRLCRSPDPELSYELWIGGVPFGVPGNPINPLGEPMRTKDNLGVRLVELPVQPDSEGFPDQVQFEIRCYVRDEHGHRRRVAVRRSSLARLPKTLPDIFPRE